MHSHPAVTYLFLIEQLREESVLPRSGSVVHLTVTRFIDKQDKQQHKPTGSPYTDMKGTAGNKGLNKRRGEAFNW